MLVREKTRPARPLQAHFREEVRPARHQTPILGHFSCAGRTFSRLHDDYSPAGRTFSRSHPHIRPSSAKNVAHEARRHGDVETAITSAPKNCTKNIHFSLAKAMAVSTGPPHLPAKATAVSDHRGTESTGPDCGARRQWRGLDELQMAGRRYKRRQTSTI